MKIKIKKYWESNNDITLPPRRKNCLEIIDKKIYIESDLNTPIFIRIDKNENRFREAIDSPFLYATHCIKYFHNNIHYNLYLIETGKNYRKLDEMFFPDDYERAFKIRQMKWDIKFKWATAIIAACAFVLSIVQACSGYKADKRIYKIEQEQEALKQKNLYIESYNKTIIKLLKQKK